jgi:hypothetical protein
MSAGSSNQPAKDTAITPRVTSPPRSHNTI